MARIRAKLKELRNADVRFISLVDRAASRIPFRVLKRENEMLDLMSVFKGEKIKPSVTAVVVFAQNDEAVSEEIRQSIANAGFTTEVVTKADNEETLVYSQGEAVEGETKLVRLSDQMVVVVKGLDEPTGMFGEIVAEHGFYPGFEMALVAFGQKLNAIIRKSDDTKSELKEVLDSFDSYVKLLAEIPSGCFKADDAVNAVIVKMEQSSVNGLKPDGKILVEEKSDEIEEDMEDEVICEKCGSKKKLSSKEDTEVCKGCGGTMKKKKKAEETVEVTEVVETPKEEAKTEEKPEVVQKSDLQQILEALSAVTAKVDGVTMKVDAIAAEQVGQKKVLDDVVQKADTLEDKFKTTIVAAPVNGDRPSGSGLVKKSDDDPRTGCFDTAFIPGRRHGRI